MCGVVREAVVISRSGLHVARRFAGAFDGDPVTAFAGACERDLHKMDFSRERKMASG